MLIRLWRENSNHTMFGYTWTWTLAVLLLIFTYRLLRPRLRRPPPPPPPSSAAVSLPASTPVIVSDSDLKRLIDESSGDDVWESVVDKSNSSISYKAKCCKPKDGPVKYLSVTTFEDCSVEVLLNFYMDNHYRMQWDKTVQHHEQLQVDRASGTEFGRTIKKFPLVTRREYVLAWRLWQGVDGSFYCFSKECEHPLAPKVKNFVRVAVFRSGWRIRKVPGRNACEITMVHQEDAGLNVEMAKMAFAKGIWSYVCKMNVALRKYSTGEQRQLNSIAGGSLPIQKVPPEFEAMNDMSSTVYQENSDATVNNHVGTCKPDMRKFTRRPSSKLIANGIVLLGGAIYLSRGHSSLGTKVVAMAYMLNKLTKHGASFKKSGKRPFEKGS